MAPRSRLLMAMAMVAGSGAGLVACVTPAAAAPPVLTGVKQVSVGYSHTCTVLTDGRVKCWGANGYGQLGDSTLQDRPLPVEVRGVSGATQVAAGGLHTCAIVTGGAVMCWGESRFGSLGYGTSGRATANAVTGLTGATRLAAGPSHTCAIVAGGRVKCWGNNDSGQLGDGTATQRGTPVEVAGIAGATRLSAGGTQIMQPGLDVFLGRGITCALVGGGKVKCWGYNRYGQLGDGTREERRLTPVAVVGLAGQRDLAVQHSVITALEFDDAPGRTCALAADGAVRCWGGYGAPGPAVAATFPGATTLGGSCVLVGDRIRCAGETPPAVAALRGVTQYSEGRSHSCAVLADTRLRCWGRNDNGQIGNGTGTLVPWPRAVVGITDAAAVSAGAEFGCALVTGGRVKCWGSNQSGQIGARADVYSRATPLAVPSIQGATAIASGDRHSCVRLGDGGLLCWGADGFGELGDGQPEPRRNVPVPVRSLPGARAVAAGHGHTCALVAAGKVRCWGWNAYGQLGDGTVTDRLVPVTVTGLPTATQITAGFAHTCALVSGGRVLCWGVNSGGRLGDGTSADRRAPVAVKGITGAVQIAAGEAHTCARSAGGQVWCWGSNRTGAVGDGTNVDQPAPVAVKGLAGVKQIALGARYSCAVLADGGVRCWGVDPGLQPRAGGARSEPVPVPGLTGVTQLAAGGAHACARVVSGQILCWGGNAAGQLGGGTTTNWPDPVLVRDGPAPIS